MANVDFIPTFDLRLGDSSEVLKALEPSSIDMVMTSPPYDNLRDYKGYCFDFETIANELFRVVKDGGVVVWVVNDATVDGSETGSSFRQALYFKEIGFNIHDTMIWKKDTSAFPDQNRYPSGFEYMFVFSKGKPKTFNPIRDRQNKYVGTRIHGTYRNKDGQTVDRGDAWRQTVCGEYGCRFNVWEIPTEKNNTTGHPAVYPIALAQDHILSWTNEEDTVLDPFMGSGTTGVACKQTFRNFIGVEISPEYYDIAKNRIAKTWVSRRLF